MLLKGFKMYKKIIKLVFFFIICSQAVFANVFNHPQKLAVIANNLPELNNISCKFQQEKTFNNSNVKIYSSGDFNFIKNKGITFHTTYPTDFVTSYNSSEYKQINDIINAISTKSYSKIEKVFQFYFENTNNTWCLGLIPKQNHQCAKYLSSIEIQGAQYIKKIVITTKNSGKTTIRFNK